MVQHNTSAARGHEATTYSIRKAGMPLVAQNNKGSQSLVAQNNKGSHPGGQALVAQNNTQETDVQETDSQEDSNQPPPQKTRPSRRKGADTPASAAPAAQRDTATPTAPYSAYIAGVVQDHSTDLGDGPHWRANVTQALRLWHASGFAEEAFVAHLHAARQLVRTYQGKQGTGTIANRMGYYFKVLADRVGAPVELGAGR